MATRTRRAMRKAEMSPEELRFSRELRDAWQRNFDYWNLHVSDIYEARPEGAWLAVVYDDDQVRYFDDMRPMCEFLDSLEPLVKRAAVDRPLVDREINWAVSPLVHVPIR